MDEKHTRLALLDVIFEYESAAQIIAAALVYNDFTLIYSTVWKFCLKDFTPPQIGFLGAKYSRSLNVCGCFLHLQNQADKADISPQIRQFWEGHAAMPAVVPVPLASLLPAEAHGGGGSLPRRSYNRQSGAVPSQCLLPRGHSFPAAASCSLAPKACTSPAYTRRTRCRNESVTRAYKDDAGTADTRASSAWGGRAAENNVVRVSDVPNLFFTRCKEQFCLL